MKFLIIMALIVPLSLRAGNILLPQNAELQWRICEDNLDVAVQKLKLQVKKVKTRQVMLWDTSDGDFLRKNWTIRVRDTGKHFSYAAKRNYYDSDYHPPKGAECELDMKATGEKIGCSVKVKTNTLELPAEIMSALKRDDNVIGLLDKAQFWGTAISANIEFENDTELEQLSFQNFHRIEFSMRVRSSERFQAWTEWDNYLKSNNIKLCPEDLQLGSRELLREFVLSN